MYPTHSVSGKARVSMIPFVCLFIWLFVCLPTLISFFRSAVEYDLLPPGSSRIYVQFCWAWVGGYIWKKLLMPSVETKKLPKGFASSVGKNRSSPCATSVSSLTYISDWCNLSRSMHSEPWSSVLLCSCHRISSFPRSLPKGGTMQGMYVQYYPRRRVRTKSRKRKEPKKKERPKSSVRPSSLEYFICIINNTPD